MRGTWWALGVVMAGCGDTPPPTNVSVATDPTEAGRWGSDSFVQDVDLGERTDGFASTVQVRVHHPTTQRTTGASEIVVLMPDEGVSIDDLFATGNHLASHGFLVVAPQFDRLGIRRTRAGLVDDTRALLDVFDDGGITVTGIEIRPAPYALVGHGRGGAVALVAADGQKRVGAVLAIDPDDSVPASGEDDADTWPRARPVVGKLAADLGFVGFGRSSTSPVCVPEDQGWGPLSARAPDDAPVFALPSSGHLDLLDGCDASGAGVCQGCAVGDAPLATRTFVRATATAFLGTRLRGDDGYDTWFEDDQYLEILEDAVRSGVVPPTPDDTGDSGAE